MTKKHGKLKDGTPVTDAQIEALADHGRPSIGSGPASVESVRLDPELERDLLLRAAEEHISVSEVIRRALRSYV